MTIDPVSGLTGPTPAAASAPQNDLGQEQFLELMLAQLQNQSPLDPMDSEQFLGQLAQFSTIEQLTAVNAGLDNLAVGQAGIVAGQVVSMIGHRVVYDGAESQLVDGSGSIRYDLGSPAERVTIRIQNGQGVPVRTLEFSGQDAGQQAIEWNAEGLPDGTYTFEVEAVGADGQTIDNVETESSGRVDGVTYRNGIPELLIGDSRRAPAQILRIEQD